MNGNEKIVINAENVGGMSDIGMDEMESFFHNHFIRVDERGRIVLGYSDVPEFDSPPPGGGETDILINGRGGRHFRLTLDGELTGENPIELMFNEQNVPLLKWDAKNKKIARRAEKEIQADIEALKPPLEAHQEGGIIQTHMILVEGLQTPIEFEGRLFSVTMEKQTLLAKQLSMWSISKQQGLPFQLNWNATGEVCEPWEFPALFKLAGAMTAHVEPLVKMQREAEVRIKRAKNETEVQGHVEKFRNEIWAKIGK